MAELPSETHSETEYENLVASYQELYENLKLNAAVCVLLLEQAGGAAEFTPEELQAVDLSKSNIALSFDEEKKIYRLEGVYDESE